MRSEIECRLNDPAVTGYNCLVSLFSPRVSTLPDELRHELDPEDPLKTSASFIGWMKDHKADAVARVVSKDGKVVKYGLRSFGMFIVPTDERTAKQILSGINKPGVSAFVTTDNLLLIVPANSTGSA